MSMPLRAILVDDEENARENLKIMLEDFCPDIQILASAENTAVAESLINEHNPDVVFLDVMMPGEDGFSFLQRSNERNYEVVFTTAHDQYALKAIKENAVHYLQKPIDINDLQDAVKRVSDRKKGVTEEAPELNKMLKDISQLQNSGRTAIPTRDGLALVRNREIIRLEAQESYTMIYLEGGSKYLSSKPIKAYEEHLEEHMFFRIHKSHIVNVRYHLREFNRTEGNVAIMSNNDHVPVARRKLQSFLDRIVSF